MRRSVALILPILLLVACGPVAQAPTATPIPSATPAPTSTPTATPAPTSTPAPTVAPVAATTPGAGLSPQALLAGVQAAATADSYRVKVTMRGSGNVGAIALGSPQAPAEIMGMDGAFAGADYSFTLTGFVTALYGSSSAQGVRAAHVAGQDYIHGPVAVIGATQSAWYRLPKARAVMATPPLYPAGLLALVSQSGVDPTGFTPSGQDQLDGQACDRFSGDRLASLAILKSLGDSGLPVDTAPDHIDQVASSLWLCQDGYLHQVELRFAGATPGDKPLPFDFTLMMHMYDFAADVGVVAPESALDLGPSPAP